MPDPGLVTPYVQQWSPASNASQERRLIEVRYVGNHGTKRYRGIDYNQVLIKQLLPDFKTAQNNGSWRRRRTTALTGLQPGDRGKPAAARLSRSCASGGRLDERTVRSYIQTGQVGELANYYQTNGFNGAINFYTEPNVLGANVLTNYSNSTYNALQVELQRRFSTASRSRRITPIPPAQRRRATSRPTSNPSWTSTTPSSSATARDFDLTHVLKANASYELPFGTGHKITSSNGVVNSVIGGWNISGYYFIQTGSPFSVLSARGTLNRGARSTWNTANTTLDKEQLDNLFGVYMTGNGPYFVNASAIGPDGRAVAGDGLAPFNGQVFFQPGAGTLGQLQRNYLDGPSIWNMDFKVSKMTHITERQSLELRLDASNVFNHQGWYISDQTLTSTSFGRITSTFFSPRRLQISLYYRF